MGHGFASARPRVCGYLFDRLRRQLRFITSALTVYELSKVALVRWCARLRVGATYARSRAS